MYSRYFMKTDSKKKKFSLIELGLVVVIVVIITAMIVNAVSNYFEEAKHAACTSARGSMLRLYTVDIIQDPTLTLQEHIDKSYTEESCPLGGKYIAINGGTAIFCNICDVEEDEAE